MSSAADLLDTMAKARDQLRAAERDEAEARKLLRAAQDKLKAANKRYLAAIDEALDAKKRPGLPFDEVAAETKALQMAVAETKPVPAGRDPVPHADETEAWSRRASTGASGTGQDADRLKKQIAEFREDQKIDNAHAMWNHWSEFFVPLLADGRDAGERVRVLAKPEWDGETGRHHIEFWHPRISETGYWSIVTTKAGAMLVEWCREHIQQQADAFRDDRAAKAPPKIIDVLNLPKPKRARKPKAAR